MFLSARKGSKILGFTNEGIVKRTFTQDGRKMAMVRWHGAKRDIPIQLNGSVWSSAKARLLSVLMAEREENIRNWNLAKALAEVQSKNEVLPL